MTQSDEIPLGRIQAHGRDLMLALQDPVAREGLAEFIRATMQSQSVHAVSDLSFEATGQFEAEVKHTTREDGYDVPVLPHYRKATDNPLTR